jgi:serine/threonine protein kinase
MGDVYKAEHKLMDRPVALKLINRDLVKNAQAVERFRREVRTAARLRHPNIVTAHDAEQAGDVHFLVTEFVDGQDLASEVRNRGPLPIAEACDYIRQAAEGLQHAHEAGMVHRDIKPHNLMLSDSGEVRILDFGLAAR